MSLLGLLYESEELFTRTQIHLLDSLLGDEPTSETALRNWAETVNLDDLDSASFRLLPPLYSRCKTMPALEPHLGRIKGVYRYFFYRNNRFLVHIEQFLSALIKADIDFIVFK